MLYVGAIVIALFGSCCMAVSGMEHERGEPCRLSATIGMSMIAIAMAMVAA